MPVETMQRDIGRNEMKLSRRRFHHLVAAPPPCRSTAPAAQRRLAFPPRALGRRLRAGGGNDIVARLMGQWFADRQSASPS